MIERLRSKITREYNNFQWKDFQPTKNFDPSKVLIIAGDPRGGTTWLAELIQSIPRTEIIWEPLWIDREPTFKNLNFSHRQFIPEVADLRNTASIS